MHDMTPIWLGFLFFTAILASIVDTLAGGGGLITVPALLLTGMPPATVLGTNKLQMAIGECNASIRFIRHGKINIRSILPGIICAICASVLGALLVPYIHPTILNKLIPFLTLGVLIYIIFSSRLLKISEKFLVRPIVFYIAAGLILGFYNGFFGPGTGSFWIFAFMLFLGFDLKQAALHGKPLNFSGNVASVFCFIFAGLVNYKIALIMAAGQIIGSYIGSHLVIKQDVKIIKPIFITVVFILTCINLYHII